MYTYIYTYTICTHIHALPPPPPVFFPFQSIMIIHENWVKAGLLIYRCIDIYIYTYIYIYIFMLTPHPLFLPVDHDYPRELGQGRPAREAQGARGQALARRPHHQPRPQLDHPNDHGTRQRKSIDCRIVPGSFPNPVVSVGVCYTAVDAAAGGLTTGWWAVVLERFSSHPLKPVYVSVCVCAYSICWLGL